MFVVQCFILVMILHYKDVIISAQQTTVMVIPLKVGLVVECLDRSSYWIRLIFIQLFLNLTNSILLESFSRFPLGWIAGTIIPLVIDNFWWTITNKYRRILGKPMTDEDKYSSCYNCTYHVHYIIFYSNRHNGHGLL
ncbi:unnamed protein product [Adineta steineri]|uniref:Uncharacterized protein n=1 Tax=Adineta steineri TaxID=433720 RepID=A0A814CRL4_9BILA|nr:unnamed protein product [Adineta steineri]